MPRRTIYSADQASPSTYDTTLADFLDRIPQLVGQYQQNQLQLDRQKLADKRYEDEKKFRDIKYSDQKEQQEFTNELNLIQTVPQGMRSGVMKTSPDPKISALGDEYSEQESAIQDLLNPNIENENLKYFKSQKTNPAILNNPTALKQLNSKIESLERKGYEDAVGKWIEENPNDPKAKALSLTYKIDPKKSFESIIPYRSSISSSIQKWNPAQLTALEDDLRQRLRKHNRGSRPEDKLPPEELKKLNEQLGRVSEARIRSFDEWDTGNEKEKVDF